MLEIVTVLAGDIEDAGDDLVNEFGRYKLGRKTYQGGSFLGGLVQAVIRFISRWTRIKQSESGRAAADRPGRQCHKCPKNLSAEVEHVVSPSAETGEHGPDH
ncbi:hypothetical protein [Synechococcus sp. 1G10]|uniref:hypothetical protein n=1 Tax=Synechococcus sp. 1G10 TaxID=2025605 RepID=UPI00117D9755|nr:hypothetical protein [Synechococcus sp. 1G10]